METYLDKMKDYLKMESEIPFAEFESYYKGVMKFLQQNFEEMEQGDLIKGRFITTILGSNASTRAERKEPQFKKYRKMAQKSNFWSDAIEFRLVQAGMSLEEIEAEEQKFTEAV